MRQWIKAFVSILLVLLSFGIIWSIRSLQIPSTSTGYFVFTAGVSLSLLVGTALILSTLYHFVSGRSAARIERKTEKMTVKDIYEKLERRLLGINPIEMEKRLISGAGAIAAYLKKRGVSRGRLTERGQYLTYEVWASAVKKVVNSVLEKYPVLRRTTYLLDKLSKIDVLHLSEMMEDFAHLYEKSRRMKLDYVPAQDLRNLRYSMEKHK